MRFRNEGAASAPRVSSQLTLTSLPGHGGNVRRAAEAGLLLRVPGIHQREGQGRAEDLLRVHRHEQTAGHGAELRPGRRRHPDWTGSPGGSC